MSFHNNHMSGTPCRQSTDGIRRREAWWRQTHGLERFWLVIVVMSDYEIAVWDGRMWSIWMFTVPSLRARDCPPPEKDALNILFLLMCALPSIT
jgi:hypothetical protein